MLRAIFFAALVAVVAARSLEQERLTLDRDAEIVPQSEIDAVEVPADEKPAAGTDNADEGRQFVFPRVKIFRFPPPFFRTSPLFPGFFNPRPAFGGSSSSADEPDSSLFDFSDILSPASPDTNKRVDGDETTPAVLDSEAPEAPEFVPQAENAPRPTQRRPSVFPSLADMFGDLNRRMQAFEDDIAGLFRTFVRVPERAGEAEVAVPATTATEEEEDQRLPARPNGFGFNLFRPFRHFGSNVFGFRNPSEFPNTYKNSTSKTEIVNGTKMMVNETIVKGGDSDSSHFVHFKVIHMVPHGEEEPAFDTETPTEVEQMTEKTEEVSTPSSTSTSEASSTVPRVDLSAHKEEQKKEGVNPADFGYQIGDNEISKGDEVEVINLPTGGHDADLPSGIAHVEAV